MAKKLALFSVVLLFLACNQYSKEQFIGHWKVVDVKISASTADSTAEPQFLRGLVNFFASAMLKNLRFDIEQDSANLVFSKLLNIEEKYKWSLQNNYLTFTNDSDTLGFEVKEVDKELMKLKLITSAQDSSQIIITLIRQ